MSMATLNEELIPILRAATERVEIQDKNGDVIGYFTPIQNQPYERKSPYSIEEIREVVRNKGKGMSLAEVLKKIGAE